MRLKRIGAGLFYVSCLALVILLALGAPVQRWQAIAWITVMAGTTASYQYAIRLYRFTIALQEATINGQQELIKDALSELNRRNRGMN